MSEAVNNKLSDAQKAKIEANRQKAMLLRRAKLVQLPGAKIDTNIDKSVIKIHGSKYIDSGGGFLIKESIGDPSVKTALATSEPIHEAINIPPSFEECLECGDKFADSYLFKNFGYSACDKCRDSEEKHSLITKTEAKQDYLLKDCDFDKREPPLRFISKKNPHHIRGEMKLYLNLQVEKRAIEVYGSEDEIIKQREERIDKRELGKMKKYSKQIKQLRMNVRSSLYTKPIAATHVHEFGSSETYNEEDDNYTRICETCQYSETFEKM